MIPVQLKLSNFHNVSKLYIRTSAQTSTQNGSTQIEINTVCYFLNNLFTFISKIMFLQIHLQLHQLHYEITFPEIQFTFIFECVFTPPLTIQSF
jgi:hypothetical protein